MSNQEKVLSEKLRKLYKDETGNEPDGCVEIKNHSHSDCPIKVFCFNDEYVEWLEKRKMNIAPKLRLDDSSVYCHFHGGCIHDKCTNPYDEQGETCNEGDWSKVWIEEED